MNTESTMQRKWDGKENHSTAILFCNVNQNGLALFNSCYFVQRKNCSNKTDPFPCISQFEVLTSSITGFILAGISQPPTQMAY